MRSADLRRSGARVRVVLLALLGLYVVLAARAVHLTVIDGRGAERGIDQAGAVVRVAPARGLVTDRRGAELAVTVSAPSVYAEPRRIADPEAAADALAPAVGLPARTLRERLDGDGAFVFLRRWIDDERARAVEALGLPGVGIVGEPRRAYPHGDLAGRLVGFANIDGEGVRGIEQLEDGWVRGHAQTIRVERDARRRLLASAGHDPRGAAGGDVALTLDAALQADAERALAEVVEATGARGGVVVVLDPYTGDLLAAAEAPGFDPNAFRTTPYPETRSRLFLDAVEPGSTLKLFTVAAGLESGAIAPDDLLDCEEGAWRVPGKTLRDATPHGRLDPAGVLRVSSNIGAAKIGYRIGAESHDALLRAFGFGSPTGSGFPDESAGLLRAWPDWQPVDHATISFGQGISVTAVQLAAAAAAIATDGERPAPRLVRARRAPGGPWRALAPPRGTRVLRPAVAARLREMLAGVVGEGGTGRRAALAGVRVGGKTGTAQKLDPATGTYSSNRYLAWFVGMAPVDEPELVVVAMIDEPQGRFHSGGSTAAPLFARVTAAGLGPRGLWTEPLYGLPRLATVAAAGGAGERPAEASRDAGERPTEASRDAGERPAEASRDAGRTAALMQRALPDVARLGDRILLPDLRGYTDVELRDFGAGLPFRLVIRGRGRAVTQEPPAGTVVAGGRVDVRCEDGATIGRGG